MVVRVAIDLALDRLFDYEVPEALEKKLAIGQLLSVPFGHREARGFAMALVDAVSHRVTKDVSSSSDAERLRVYKRLKPVTAIVDETPFFSPALLELVKKIAAYTAAPIESVLKAALPASVLKKNVRPRELMFIEPRLAAVPVSLTKRQQWLYDQIVRLGGGWMTQLCEELKTTPATIKELGKLGLVTVAVRARRRDPLAGRKILATKPLKLNEEQSRALEAIEGRETRDMRQELAGRETRDARQELAGRETRDARQEPGDSGSCDFARVSRLASHALTTPLASRVSRLTPSPLASPLASPLTSPRPILLHGVTGSGKTEVYLQAIARELAAGRGAIVLVPEIALTPQTVARFAGRFGTQVAVLHSALSDGERYDEWHRIRNGAARVVVGPRSAVFAPVKDLGLIVVDEEHESSYKQEELPRYHARDVAVLRGAIEGARVVLGSATPSLESWHNVELGKYALATMSRRAGAGTMPNVLLVDLKETVDAVSHLVPVDAVSHRVTKDVSSSSDAERLRVYGDATARRVGKGGNTSSSDAERLRVYGETKDVSSSSDAERLRVYGDATARRVREGLSPRGAIFSSQLLEAIRMRLDRHEQTILFLNRRGYSRSVVCDGCGHVLTCPACDLPYTYHRADSCLRCHVCGGWQLLPKACPACGATALSYKGIGTQRAEAALKACCPRAVVLRMDADSTSRKNSHDDILSAFRRGEADVLLGTQMIAKGLDFPNVTLVGVLNADSSLMMPDFRAAERTYQLLAQVAGRAGRAELPGEVIIQSWDPSAFAIRAAARGDFEAFARCELADRAEGWFPPYCHLATVNLKSKDLTLVASWADMYAKSLMRYAVRAHGRFVVGEAVPSALEKADGYYRWQIVLRAERTSAIVSAWRWITSVRPPKKNLTLALDVDANNLL